MLPLVSSITTTRDRLDFVFEEDERLRLVVVEDLEIVLRQVGHEALLRVGDGREQRHDLGAGPERRLLGRPSDRRHGGGQRQEATESRAGSCRNVAMNRQLTLQHRIGDLTGRIWRK